MQVVERESAGAAVAVLLRKSAAAIWPLAAECDSDDSPLAFEWVAVVRMVEDSAGCPD